jgi:predicted hydrolase (HD superfamily)
VKSVTKKFKTPAFAAKIKREVIQQGANMLCLSLEELIQETILALRPVATEIGLKGNL